MPLTPEQIRARLPNGTQRELATKVRVHETYVSRVVQGTMRPTSLRGLRTLRRVQVAVARRLGMKVDDVFAGPVTPHDRPEHPRHDRRDVLGRGESRARAVGGAGRRG